MNRLAKNTSSMRSMFTMERLVLLMGIGGLALAPPGIHAQKFENLALTPPMGWNSWNYYHCDGINERTVMETADAMVRSGMKEAGYHTEWWDGKNGRGHSVGGGVYLYRLQTDQRVQIRKMVLVK